MNNKNPKDFLEAMGNIDDKLIESAMSYKKKKGILHFKKYMAVAACFALVAFSVFIGMSHSQKNDSTLTGENSINDDTEKAPNINNDEVFEGQLSQSDDNQIEDEDVEQAPDNDKNEDTLSEGVDFNTPEGDLTSEEEIEEDENPSDSSTGNSGVTLPPLTEQVEIDDLNKLAYYSGWTMLRKYGAYNQKMAFSKYNDDSLKLLTSIGYDISEEDIAIGTVYSQDLEIDISNEFEGLIPIDPGFGNEVIAYAIYSINVNAVEYFQIQIVNDCFLASQIGKGYVEVMILDVDFDQDVSETMIVFKNKDKYFSCLLDTFLKGENDEMIYTFTASKYVSNFNIVKMPSLSPYSFTVKFENNSSKYPQITLKHSDSVSFYVSSETYNNARNVSISNSASGLTEELYKIYLEEVVAGEREPMLPEKPVIPDLSQDSSDGDIIEVNVSFNGLYTDKASFSGDNGYMLLKGGSEQSEDLKNKMPCDELSKQIDSIPEEVTYLAIWIKGRARFADYQFFVSKATNLEFVFNYIIFEESDSIYTLFLFELWDGANVTAVYKPHFNNVNYTQKTSATFTTVNEYDYITGNEKEDEYIINFGEDGFYYLYKNEQLIYQNGYKITEGYVVLCTDFDTFYLELSPVSTFVYNIDGRNRIFMLE